MKKHLLAAALVVAAVIVAVVFAPNTAVAFAADKLSTPVGVELVEQDGHYYIVWGGVLDNAGYTVKIDGIETSVAQNEEKFNVDSFVVGVEHSVAVKAIGTDGTADSDYSAVVTIVKKGKLSAPTNLDVDADLLLTWDAVANASYKITVNGIIVADDLDANSFSLADKLYSTGLYSIKIKALGNGGALLDSDYSVALVYTYKKDLASPENLSVTLSDGVITANWDAVQYATSYEVSVDGGAPIAASGLSIDITSHISEVKDYQIRVRAVDGGNFVTSDYTSAVTYKNESKIVAPVITVSGDVASWVAPVGADRYTVLVRNSAGNVYSAAEFDGLSLDMGVITAGKPVGEYEIQVQALKNGNYNTSDIAAVSYYKYEKLASPIITVDGTVVSWTAVTNAVNYTVTVDGAVREATFEGLSYDLAVDIAEAKTYVVTVKANAYGWYRESDVATYNFVYGGKLGTPDVSANGQTVNWTAVLGASDYIVTVDGETVATTTELTYDLSAELTENKEYTVGVYAAANGSYTAGDVKTVMITGVASIVTTKTYCIPITVENPVLFVDGVKTSAVLDVNKCVELPSSAEKLIIVPDASTVVAAEMEGENVLSYGTYLFAEINLADAIENEGIYTISPTAVYMVSEMGEANPAATVEGYGQLSYEGNIVYYHIKPNYANPVAIIY